jgi:hypothetical protein
LWFDFDRTSKLKFLGSQVTTDAGRLTLPKSIRQWSLTTLREKLVKIGAKVARHSKYVTFQLAEIAVPRQLFAAILERRGDRRTYWSFTCFC